MSICCVKFIVSYSELKCFYCWWRITRLKIHHINTHFSVSLPHVMNTCYWMNLNILCLNVTLCWGKINKRNSTVIKCCSTFCFKISFWMTSYCLLRVSIGGLDILSFIPSYRNVWNLGMKTKITGTAAGDWAGGCCES